MSATTDHLIANLSMRVPGVIRPVLDMEVFNAVNELCRNTHAYRDTIDVPLTAGSVEYDMSPIGKEILKVHTITHGSLDLSDLSHDGHTLLLAQTPSSADAQTPIYIEVSLVPVLTGAIVLDDLLPDDYWTTWMETVLDGALGRLMGQIAKPYSNPTMATYHMKRFRNGMAQARLDGATGFDPAVAPWSFPRWA